MKGTEHTPEQIVRKLREADRLLGEGQDRLSFGCGGADSNSQRSPASCRRSNYRVWRDGSDGDQTWADPASDPTPLPHLRDREEIHAA